MRYLELIHKVASENKLSVDVVRQVLDASIKTTMDVLGEGDQVKLTGLGTLYPKTYDVRKGNYEFGTESTGGQRRQVRFRPFDSTNWKLTQLWEKTKQPT